MENRGGERRHGVERGGGASEGMVGLVRIQGGRVALQTAAQAVSGRGKPWWRQRAKLRRNRTLKKSGEDLFVIFEKSRGLGVN
jgi:hypothetical protein